VLGVTLTDAAPDALDVMSELVMALGASAHAASSVTPTINPAMDLIGFSFD
jgi:hypothetical protein